MDAKDILKGVETVLVIDWPSKEVPELLARRGINVVVRGGPGPEDYSAYEVKDGEIVVRRTGGAPKHVDLIYSYRPLSELPGIIASAKELGAGTIWSQSGLNADGKKDPRGCWFPESELRVARGMVEAAGLTLIVEPYIGDVAREL